MNSRIITVYSTQVNKRNDITTDVTTWAELQNLLSEKGIAYSGMTATENRTKTNLELGIAVLPEGNFTLFLSPSTKIKSGIDWRNMSYNEIRKYATSIGVSGLGTTTEIADRINNWETANDNRTSFDEILNSKFPTVAAKLDAFIEHTNNQFAEVADAVNSGDNFHNAPFNDSDNTDLAEEAARLGL